MAIYLKPRRLNSLFTLRRWNQNPIHIPSPLGFCFHLHHLLSFWVIVHDSCHLLHGLRDAQDKHVDYVTYSSHMKSISPPNVITQLRKPNWDFQLWAFSTTKASRTPRDNGAEDDDDEDPPLDAATKTVALGERASDERGTLRMQRLWINFFTIFAMTRLKRWRCQNNCERGS
jgi:hypothetical protein